MEFYAGRPDEIGRAFTDVELDELRNGSLAHSYADLSLHLSPDHLDFLSEEVAKSLGPEVQPLLLLDCLERQVGGTNDESSADVVAEEWVRMIAATQPESIAPIVGRWIAMIAAEEGDPTIGEGDHQDAERALSALIQLCRESLQRKSRVVFAWCL